MRRWLRVAVWCVAFGTAPVGAISVTDAEGARLDLAAPAARIVTLAPHLAELVHAAGAGAQLVGVSAYSDYPPTVHELPQVSDHARVDLERLLQLNPDLVLAWGSGNRPRDIARLRAAGLPVYVSEARALADIAQTLVDIGALSGQVSRSQAAARDYQAGLAALRARYAGQATLRVFYQVSARPLITISGAHLISQALAVCGAENVFADLSLLAPRVTLEAVYAADPDAIVVGAMAGATDAAVQGWQAHGSLRAVRAGAVHGVSADLLHRATPRMVSGIEQLCGVLREGRGD